MIIPLAFFADKPLLYKHMVFSGRVIQTTVPKDPQGKNHQPAASPVLEPRGR